MLSTSASVGVSRCIEICKEILALHQEIGSDNAEVPVGNINNVHQAEKRVLCYEHVSLEYNIVIYTVPVYL